MADIESDELQLNFDLLATDDLSLAFGDVVVDDNAVQIGDPASVSAQFFGRLGKSSVISREQTQKTKSALISKQTRQRSGLSVHVSHLFVDSRDNLRMLNSEQTANSPTPKLIENCFFGVSAGVISIRNSFASDSNLTVQLATLEYFEQVKTLQLISLNASDTVTTEKLQTCIYESSLAKLFTVHFYGDSDVSVRAPCVYHPIVLDDAPIADECDCPCGPIESDELDLAFERPRELESDMLILDFACEYPKTAVIKKNYMIIDTVKAEVDGVEIGIYSASVSTSMDTFCWQFDISISHKDFAQLNLETRTDDPLLTLTVNGHPWVMLIEDYTEDKKFNFDGYTLKGRSKTALLTKDYVARESSLVSTDMSVAQIAQNILSGLDFNVVYDSDNDWFVPANTYTISGTPIEALTDIANAGGHYLASDPVSNTLYIRKRWPVAAWEIATADRQLPPIWYELSGSRQINTRYNSVRLSGSGDGATGGQVYRSNSAGDKTPEASAETHVLYAGDVNNIPANAFRGKGQQILSDSGKHKIYTVKAPWADDSRNDYGIALARLGEIIDLLDNDGSLGKGVVPSVSFDIANDLKIKQTFSTDVYLDD